jgi:2-keto-4-pentenoate hydratase/2-oxohepta-3-ene-1,7-dioic acid hydratase in catechol pathway
VYTYRPTCQAAPPIVRPSKIVCIGLNFHDHAAESGMAAPAEPVIFFKATTALCGPDDPVVVPRNGTKLDWEVELAVVIGRKAQYVAREQAAEFVAGYALHNDYSERTFQLERGGQWVKGKSADTFAPIGPFLATRDDVPDPGRLNMWLTVNGEVRQKGTTANMIFNVPTLVSYVSEFMTLLPGDVISTGTPAGVGPACARARYLKLGDGGTRSRNWEVEATGGRMVEEEKGEIHNRERRTHLSIFSYSCHMSYPLLPSPVKRTDKQ